MKRSCSTYILLFLWMLTANTPARAQITEEEINADFERLINARHGLSPVSGDFVMPLLENITTTPDPYLDVIRREFIIPSDAQALANMLTLRQALMLLLLERIDTEASREILRNLYRVSARRVDSLEVLHQEALDAGVPYERIELLVKSSGAAAMIQADALIYLGQFGDKELVPELVARYDTTDSLYQSLIEFYFEDVGEPFPAPDN